MDGLTACRTILATMGDAAPPIVALTASSSDEEMARCMAAGMTAFLTKPVKAEQMSMLHGIVRAGREKRRALDSRGPPRSSKCVRGAHVRACLLATPGCVLLRGALTRMLETCVLLRRSAPSPRLSF
jgi:CheY-like chemotaxis protein